MDWHSLPWRGRRVACGRAPWPRWKNQRPPDCGHSKLATGATRWSTFRKPRPNSKKPRWCWFSHATQGAEQGIALLRNQADEHGFLLVAPASFQRTWQIEDEWGPDFDNVDLSLALSFSQRNVNPKRISVAGFSDGASYALALGLTNGDLFNAAMAFSAGYIAAGQRVGKPPIFLSAGTEDPIFPIDSCARPMAKALKAEGYNVTLREFNCCSPSLRTSQRKQAPG